MLRLIQRRQFRERRKVTGDCGRNRHLVVAQRRYCRRRRHRLLLIAVLPTSERSLVAVVVAIVPQLQIGAVCAAQQIVRLMVQLVEIV